MHNVLSLLSTVKYRVHEVLWYEVFLKSVEKFKSWETLKTAEGLRLFCFSKDLKIVGCLFGHLQVCPSSCTYMAATGRRSGKTWKKFESILRNTMLPMITKYRTLFLRRDHRLLNIEMIRLNCYMLLQHGET